MPELDDLLCGALGRQDNVVDLAEFGVRFADDDRARKVRTVTVDDDSHVDDDPVSVCDRVVARLRVRHCAVRAGGDDRREREPFGAQAARFALDLESHPPLGPAGLDPLGDGSESCVAHVDGALERFDLGGLFDRAHLGY